MNEEEYYGHLLSANVVLVISEQLSGNKSRSITNREICDKLLEKKNGSFYMDPKPLYKRIARITLALEKSNRIKREEPNFKDKPPFTYQIIELCR